MGPVRFGRLRAAKRPYGFCAKVALAVVLGLCFIVIWSIFSSPSSSLTSQRSSFSDISIPVSSSSSHSHYKNNNLNPTPSSSHRHPAGAGGLKVPGDRNKKGDDAYAGKRATDKEIRRGRAHSVAGEKDHDKDNEKHVAAVEKNKEGNHHHHQKQRQEGSTAQSGTTSTEPTNNNKEEEVQNEGDNKDEDVPDEDVEIDGDLVQGDDDMNVSMDQETSEKMEDETVNSKKRMGKTKKNVGPLFDSRAHYSWKLCSVRSKHNYIPCIDIEGTTGKLRSYRHRERSCPAVPPLCLIPLPERYEFPVRWPESKSKVL